MVNKHEAVTIQRLFEIYLETGCLSDAAKLADVEGLRSKLRLFSSGREQGGAPLSRGQIHAMLTNPIYRGLIRHKDKTWPGLHSAIVDEDIWVKVQTALQAASARRRGVSNGASPSGAAPLLGKFRDETGDRLTPTHAQKAKRRIRYYVSNKLLSGQVKDGWRLPAPAFERAVADIIATHLSMHAARCEVLAQGTAREMETASSAAKTLADRIVVKGATEAAALIERGTVNVGSVQIELCRAILAEQIGVDEHKMGPDLHIVDSPFTCRKRGQEVKIIAGEHARQPDETLTSALRKANLWAVQIKTGIPIKDIARTAACTDSYIRRIIPLSTLSPKIQMALLNGTHPPDLTLERLIRAPLPIDWSIQEAQLGFTT